MTGPLWVPGAVKLTPSSPGGTTIDFTNAGPHMTWHTTECPSGGKPGSPDFWFWQMVSVLKSKGAEPSLVWDPLTDKLGQFFPLNQTGRALENDGVRRTNRTGVPCVQIEVVGYASRPFTRTWKPGKNFKALGDALEKWGVPYVWPSGDPPAYPGGSDERSSVIWYNRGGHYGHSQVPSNSHGDPGAISVPALFAALGKTDAGKTDPNHPGSPDSKVWPAWKKYPGYAQLGYGAGQESHNNALVSSALVAQGYHAELNRSTDKVWTAADQAALDDFKKKHKIKENGLGPDTWAALGKMPAKAKIPEFPGKDEFVVGSPSKGSLQLQALLILQGFGSVLQSRALKVWRHEAVVATRRFQASEPALSGDADGVPGPKTWAHAWSDNT